MPGLFQIDPSGRQPGRGAVEPAGESGPGKDAVEEHQQVVILGNVLPVGGALPQDAFDFLLLPGLELPELIVGLDHAHGLNEKGPAGAGHVMDQAGDLVLALRPHRHHIPPGTHGDDGLLQIFGLRGGDELLQDVPHLGGTGPDMTADIGQLGAGRVGDLLLREDGSADLFLQKTVRRQGGEEMVDAGFGAALPGGVFPGGPGAAQERGDVQQFPGVQRPSHIGPLEGRSHRADAGQ